MRKKKLWLNDVTKKPKKREESEWCESRFVMKLIKMLSCKNTKLLKWWTFRYAQRGS